MKVLIVSMTCGEGHNQIAKALKSSLEGRGAVCEIMQLYGFNERAVERKNKTFLNACKYFPHIYNGIWLRMCKKPLKSYIKGVIKSCGNHLLENVNAFEPDAIICTHNEAGAVVEYLVKAEKISKQVKTYSVVFDYCLCPYWEYDAGLDFVVLPHENMTDEILAKGFKPEQVLPLGIPVSEKFTKEYDKQKAREELGLDKDKFTVVLYSGGNCVSSAYDVIKKLLKCKTDIQIVSVCGRNETEFKKVESLKAKKHLNNVLNFGFCTCLDKLYSAGDIVVTRGGGMGVTEQINKHIPFVFREKLILNEKINTEYFGKLGLAVTMKKLGDAPKIVDSLANDSEKLARMSKNAKAFCKPNALSDFVELILNNGKGV